MSGFINNPPSFISNIYNPSFFKSDSDFITLADAEQTFAKLFDPRFSFTTDIVPGVASANKALITNASNDITGLGDLSCTSLLVNGQSVSSGISQSFADTRYVQITNAFTQTMGDARYAPIGAMTQTIGDARYVQITNAFTQTIGDARYIQSGNAIINIANDTSSLVLYQSWVNQIVGGNLSVNLRISNISSIFGTWTNHAMRFAAFGTTRLTILPVGNVGINTGSPQHQLDVAGTINCTNLLVNGAPFVGNWLGGAITPATRTINTFSVSGSLFHSSTNRFWGQRQVSENVYSLLSYSEGGGYQDHLMWDHNSGVPLLRANARLMLNSDDNTRLLSVLDPNLANGNGCSISLGRTTTLRNQAILRYFHVGTDSLTNRLDIGFGTTINVETVAALSIQANNFVGIGTNSPTCSLDVATASDITFAPSTFTTGFNLSATTGNATNMGAGPLTVAIGFRVRGNAWIQSLIYATSDRRLKRDIEPLDFTLEHYNQLEPVSYRWKADDDTKMKSLGLIAQDVKNICLEACSVVLNENLVKETEDDPDDGFQLVVDYRSITMMSIVAIKKLIHEMKIIRQDIELLKSDQ